MRTQTIAKIDSQLDVFERHESEVRSYCRSFPALFTKARNCSVWDSEGKPYIDFFAGAGTLNYGHNHPVLKNKLVQYILDDGITHSLDMATAAKKQLIETFERLILRPRRMNYKVMFPGPTGTNAVEAALKLARKVTGRQTIVSFTNAFHGMTLGSLSVTGNSFKRSGAGVPLSHTVSMPYDGYFGEGVDTAEYFERYLEDGGSGMEIPAAVILETVQGEGGLHTASEDWLKRIERICRKYGMLFIVDDIQVGCGRTGTFFSFESAGISPDMITLSKAISGYGVPLALTLLKPEIDQWSPGEHNGTFRGHNLAFVTAETALREYWSDRKLEQETLRKSHKLSKFLKRMIAKYPELQGTHRGRGMIQGIACGEDALASEICKEAFARGLIMETSGPNDEVFKVLPPLVIDDGLLDKGFDIMEQSIQAAIQKRKEFKLK